MVFNSFSFLWFFSAFFALYWFAFPKSLRWQNLVLLAASYFFYAFCNWHFVFLLAGTSLLNYVLGICISRSESPKARKLLLFTGLLQLLGVLVLFKYTDFFIVSFNDAASAFGLNVNLRLLRLALPLGISFYTFRIISYLLDVDKGKIEPVKDWVIFFSYVSFFPSLISGPIDKAKLLVPQLGVRRHFNYQQGVDGLRQILWGLFKKVVIADNCAAFTNQVFDAYDVLPASNLWLAAFFYAIQIYADFSGYSDMAIGIARLMGLNITRNFEYPFFAQNIAEFWRKWHISLTSWLTEYVFTPLSIYFRDYGNTGLILSILINFTIIGFWHGANWTFVLFGVLHGLYYIPLIIKGKLNKKRTVAKDRALPTLKEALNMGGTFVLVMLTFIVFRSGTIQSAFRYFLDLFSSSAFSRPVIDDGMNMFTITLFTLVMLAVEWAQRTKAHGLQLNVDGAGGFSYISLPRLGRWSMYFLIIGCILCFGGKSQDFIYFKF